MLLSDEQRFLIVLSAIRDYKAGENDISILIVEKVTSEISSSVDKQITTQNIFDDIVETFSYYNDFIKEKDVDLKSIPDEMTELVEYYMNEVIECLND